MLDKQVYRNTVEVTDEALRNVLTKYQQVAELTDAFAQRSVTHSHDQRRQAREKRAVSSVSGDREPMWPGPRSWG